MSKTFIASACIALAGCSDGSPSNEFFKLQINLVYPSGYGPMGYSVNRLVAICTERNGVASWESSKEDFVLNCDRSDVLTKSTLNLRWLLRPLKIEGRQIAVLLGASTNGATLSRDELEVIASSIPNDPATEEPKAPIITVPVNE